MNETLKTLIGQIVGVLEFAAALTETKIDDTVVDILKTVLESDLLSNWFANELMSANPAFGFADCPNDVCDALEDAGYSDEDVDAFCQQVLPAVSGVVSSVV